MWIDIDREAVFAAMRADRPVLWCDEPEIPGFGQGPGFWSLSRHADIMEVSRNPQQFHLGRGHHHPGHAGGDRRVLRLDDQHGRPPGTPGCG
jgi:cytochrome P450